MITSLILLLIVITCVALMTLSERKVMGSMQRRIGPNKVGYLGLLQPFADGIKLIFKETIIPSNSSLTMMIAAPYLFFFLALVNWLILPLHFGIALSEFQGAGLLFTIAIAELSIYGVLFSGWSANSKYALLGSLRSTAQLISYSISLSLIYLAIIFSIGSVNPLDILHFQQSTPLFLPLLPIAILFLISAVLECNRAPADLPEAESELVSGFMTEHSAISFAYFFLGEYTNMLFISSLFFTLFFANPSSIFFIFFFFWLRASLPRIRFDHLISLGWVHILPFLIGYFLLLPPFLFSFNII